MVVRRKHGVCIALCVLAALALCGCQPIEDYITRINQQNWTAYHESRWQAVAEACAQGREYIAPAEPITPRLCTGLELRYREVADGWQENQRTLHQLAADRVVEEEYLVQLLDVVKTRDRVRLAGLAEQLPLYERRLGDAQTQLGESIDARQAKVEKLRQAWEEIWPAAEGQELDFDLVARVLRARKASTISTPTPEDELSEYHRQHYARLAMVYLDYVPDFKPLPADQVPAPSGCSDVAAALAQYEIGLSLRYDITEAIDADITRLGDLAGFDPAEQPWAALNIPSRGWQRQRTEAALARVKLLGRADGLLTGCLDFQQAWLSEAWLLVWPGCPLETNLFAFAGQSTAAPEPQMIEDWQDQTLRR